MLFHEKGDKVKLSKHMIDFLTAHPTEFPAEGYVVFLSSLRGTITAADYEERDPWYGVTWENITPDELAKFNFFVADEAESAGDPNCPVGQDIDTYSYEDLVKVTDEE